MIAQQKTSRCHKAVLRRCAELRACLVVGQVQHFELEELLYSHLRRAGMLAYWWRGQGLSHLLHLWG